MYTVYPQVFSLTALVLLYQSNSTDPFPLQFKESITRLSGLTSQHPALSSTTCSSMLNGFCRSRSVQVVLEM